MNKSILEAKEHYSESRLALEKAITEEAERAVALLVEHGFNAALEANPWKLDASGRVSIQLEF